MTIHELKRKLIDRLGEELLKKNIKSDDFVHFATAVHILFVCEEYEYLEKITAETEQSKDEPTIKKIDLKELFNGISGLYNPKKNN